MKKDKAVIFFINTLCNGGAERVVANMANFCAKDSKVFIVTLFHQQTYELDKNIEVICLYDKKLSKFKKITKLHFIVNKIDKIISNIEKEYEIELMTSHLIYSNLLVRLSKYRKNIIHVVHVSYKASIDHFGFIFKRFLRWLYKNVPVVTVSKGCEDEMLRYYKIKPSRIRTIYNPINFDEINIKKEEKTDFDCKYFLQVGRFNKAKRQDRMVEIFFKGNFYKKYKLVFCGVGELEENAKALAKKYNIENRVCFLGWQGNIYKWMKNAELLISTSDYEAFPMNLIEALFCGTKVVSSNCDFGPKEIMIDKYSNYLAKYDDIDDYIDKINLALKSYPKEKNKIVEDCMIHNIINQYVEFMKGDIEK